MSIHKSICAHCSLQADPLVSWAWTHTKGCVSTIVLILRGRGLRKGANELAESFSQFVRLAGKDCFPG